MIQQQPFRYYGRPGAMGSSGLGCPSVFKWKRILLPILRYFPQEHRGKSEFPIWCNQRSCIKICQVWTFCQRDLLSQFINACIRAGRCACRVYVLWNIGPHTSKTAIQCSRGRGDLSSLKNGLWCCMTTGKLLFQKECPSVFGFVPESQQLPTCTTRRSYSIRS